MEKTSVLIVDDTEQILSALKRELRDEPYNLLLATSGQEALKILSEHKCKVIVSDVKMPKMNGFELLGAVKDDYPEMIRVVLSGHCDVKLILKLVNENGIDRYLTKPWNTTDVKMTIRQCIELFDLKQEVHSYREQLKIEAV
ncbi:MAG: response regulator [Desulfobacteraceae bacterium]|nr:response regulator [Desulfobacteraceae bacterium]